MTTPDNKNKQVISDTLEADRLEAEEDALEASTMRGVGIAGYVVAAGLFFYKPKAGLLFLLILLIVTKWPRNGTRRFARKLGRGWRSWNKS